MGDIGHRPSRFQYLEKENVLLQEMLRDTIALLSDTYEHFPPDIKELPQVQRFLDVISRVRLHLDLKESHHVR
jgi:hypothetical protein